MTPKSNEKIDEIKTEDALVKERAFFNHLGKDLAHQIRSPNASIRLACEAVGKILNSLFQGYKLAVDNKLMAPVTNEAHFKIIETVFASIKDSSFEIDNAVDTLLPFIESYAQKTENAEIISISACLNQLIKDYPFKNDQERALVHIDVKHEFKFKAASIFIQSLFAVLLDEALADIKEIGKGDIHITTEQEQNSNVLHFKDMGRIVDKRYLETLHEFLLMKRKNKVRVEFAFFAWTLQCFGIAVTCDSKVGEPVHFVLKFPKMSL